MDILEALGSDQDLRAVAIQKMALRARTDLFFLAKEILGYDKMTPKTHQELCDYTTSILPNPPKVNNDDFDPRKNLLLLLMPRGTFKSSVVTISFTLQFILNEPNARILIDSETFSKSKAFLREIIDHLVNNESYREIFKAIHGMYPFTKKSQMKLWTDSEVILPCRNTPKKEPTISCAGIDVTKNGMHYDLIIADDLHSEKNVTNKEQIQQVIDHYKLAFSLLDPGKPMIIIGCLTGDSKVLMADGSWKPIKDIKTGQVVMSYNEKRIERRIVTASVPQGKQKILEVKTRRHSLKCTPNHPFLVWKNKKRTWVRADELKVGEAVITVSRVHQETSKRDITGKKLNKENIWLLGFLFGDGWLIDSGKNRQGFAVAKGVDEKLNQKVIKAIENWFGKKPYETKYGYYRLDYKKAYEILKNLGFEGNAKTKRIPEWVFSTRSCSRTDFIKGLIDADGYKQTRGTAYRVELANKKLIEDIYYLALTCNIRPTSIFYRVRPALAPNSPKPTQSETWSIGLSFKRRQVHGSYYMWDRIQSIEDAGQEEVYDISVEETSNFIAEGMVVHNTRWDYSDLYQHIIDFEADDFNILKKSAYNPDGSLFFPEVLTHERLDKIKRRQGTGIFSKQYLNEPVSDENATFKREYIKRVSLEEIKGRPMNWYWLIDPSYSDPRGGSSYADYASFVLCGMDYMRELYVRHIIRAKMTYGEIIDKMFELNTQFEDIKQAKFVLEVIGTKSLSYELSNEQRRRGTWLPVTEITSRQNTKEERIRALAPFYEFGHVYHVKECPQIEDLEYELLHFPTARYDDCSDALSTVLEVASPPTHKNADVKKHKSKRLLKYKPRSPITGT